MRLAMGIMLMWIGCAWLYIASRGTQAKRPYEAYQELIGAIRNA